MRFLKLLIISDLRSDPSPLMESLGGQEALLMDAQRARLEQLCPSDFAALKRQSCRPGAISPDEFLTQLEAEYRIKPEVRESCSMGFTV